MYVSFLGRRENENKLQDVKVTFELNNEPLNVKRLQSSSRRIVSIGLASLLFIFIDDTTSDKLFPEIGEV
jgi:hypothetical protein